MGRKESKYLFWSRIQTEVIEPEQIPQTIDLSKVIKDFSTHRHHIGAWPTSPTPTPMENKKNPPNGYSSHVVRDVELTVNGGLKVSFDFYHTLHGDKFMKEYYNHGDEFVMMPVLDDEEINIVRFDFIREEPDEN